MSAPVHVIGGGLAGSEAAWQLARAGIAVVLHEMRPVRRTAAHHTDRLAELVCSNSFRSDDAMHNAVGLLHAEMRRLGSLVMRAGDAAKLPAGGALAVDRDAFAAAVQTASVNLYSEEQYVLSGADETKIGFIDNELVGVNAAEAVTTVNVLTRFDANEALLRLDRAIAQITRDRAELGAVTNRMQSTLSNLTTIIEASSASRSRIRDADFADETSDLARIPTVRTAPTREGIRVRSPRHPHRRPRSREAAARRGPARCARRCPASATSGRSRTSTSWRP